MSFLDNLILGSSTPKYTDEVFFPSKAYGRVRCSKKHCTAMCTTRSYAEYEFWAYVLSEKDVDMNEVRSNIYRMDDGLRFSVWTKCSGSREEGMELENIRPCVLDVSSDAGDVAGFEEVDFGEDMAIIKYILEICKSSDESNEEAIFSIFKNVRRRFAGIYDAKLLALVIKHVIELPYATARLVYKFICSMALHHNLNGIFVAHGNSSECIGAVGGGNDAEMRLCFWKMLISKYPLYFNYVIDFVVCNKDIDMASIPNAICKYLNSDNIEDWIDFVSIASNMNKLVDVCSIYKQEGDAVHNANMDEERYFDFLVIQNEMIKAQEKLKKEADERIRCLLNERDELLAQKSSLMEACKVLEKDLKECQERCVSKVREIFFEAESECEVYRKGTVELKKMFYEKASECQWP
ncbi:hypothetical protein HK407_11g16550 [Ordospora pajunii]|uniref:uncharacterized protein n=1 Tax=Ordospora pajunii TaxID=3039483 RepID=UPI0029527C4C|nr:uncharacterized protein HK407_11g16550 [Ordospora pajunii]KAH9410761.1 hypothetical protein HK407_11g16550 [Ordospora pajunii]